MQVQLGAHPFVAIENIGTTSEPNLRLWMNQDDMTAADAAMLGRAMRDWGSSLIELTAAAEEGKPPHEAGEHGA
jgi:hypothetical protein